MLVRKSLILLAQVSYARMLLNPILSERPGSSVVEHLHGKQVVVGSIPILGKQNEF